MNADEGFWAATLRITSSPLQTRSTTQPGAPVSRSPTPKKQSTPTSSGTTTTTTGPSTCPLDGAPYTSPPSTSPPAPPPVSQHASGTAPPVAPTRKVHTSTRKTCGRYYLLIAEGGSGANHSATIARSSSSIWGLYDSFAGNPILTNRGTEDYFQAVGHADFFQDGGGDWWGTALATRADIVYFHAGEAIPQNWLHHRIPLPSSYTISPPGHPKTLQLVPSTVNLTGNAAVGVADGLTFIARRQTATLFKFSVDLEFDPKVEREEAGVTVFISREQHIDLAIVSGLPAAEVRRLRFKATTFGKPMLRRRRRWWLIYRSRGVGAGEVGG
ncbi:hypothetical protein V501_10177 [Pseudogymnoascus sp. VKM F-4519 (FW-2642)]|nr:hypothetical protein V501_10177 [Pseudogymnoascus sp. VKM F-4519 (FW-2642)]